MTEIIRKDNLTCTFTTEEEPRLCYLISPLPTDGHAISTWSKRYGYNIAVITGTDWNNDLTPWPAEGLGNGGQRFGGNAPKLLDMLCDRLMPEIEHTLGLPPDTERTLAGISLAGLFAVWAWALCGDFNAIASISGSFWYDGFSEWIGRQALAGKTGHAYFSLGNKERRSGNRRFKTIENDTAQVVAALERNGITTMFEYTAGSHFAPIQPRIEMMFAGLNRLTGQQAMRHDG